MKRRIADLSFFAAGMAALLIALPIAIVLDLVEVVKNRRHRLRPTVVLDWRAEDEPWGDC